MIRKSGYRFSEKIMPELKKYSTAWFNLNHAGEHDPESGQ
jgi:hypothetical protein